MVCLSCGKQGHYNKLNFVCPLNNKNQANAVKYGAQEELQQKEDNEGTRNLPPSMDTIGMTADENFMPAAGSGKTIFTGTGAGMASLDPVRYILVVPVPEVPEVLEVRKPLFLIYICQHTS